MFFFSRGLHPALRIVIGAAVVAAGVLVHRELLTIVGVVFAVLGGAQWLRRTRGPGGTGGSGGSGGTGGAAQ